MYFSHLNLKGEGRDQRITEFNASIGNKMRPCLKTKQNKRYKQITPKIKEKC